VTGRRAISARAALVVPLFALLDATTACDRGRASEPGGVYARKVADAVPRVEKAVGLPFKSPPKLEVRSKAQVREFVERQFNESRVAQELSLKERAYKRFALLPDTLDLRKLLTNLLEEQIVGFYDPKAKTLYVVEGSPPEAAGLVVAHELVHALQDQYVNLDSLQNVPGRDDHVGAAQAVMEGQATVAQLGDASVAASLPGGWDRVRQMIREQQASMPIFASAPTLIQETLIFPYLSGAEFMRHASDASISSAKLYADLPASTEQILHPERYLQRDAPTEVTLFPAPGGRAVAYENTLGEFETRLFLYERLRDETAAVRGARGWDGDRYALLDAAGGEALVWLTVWDSAVDAAEFNDLLGRAPAQRPGATQGGSSGRSVTVSAGEVDGRPVVLYVDAPAGAPPPAVDLDAVRLR
jgi:hypothetical protein